MHTVDLALFLDPILYIEYMLENPQIAQIAQIAQIIPQSTERESFKVKKELNTIR